MWITATKRILEFQKAFPDARGALEEWTSAAEDARWRSLQDVRSRFPSADGVVVKSGRVVTVFNIRGNRYRLITAIHYNHDRIFILRFFTHAEYDKDQWKDQL